MSDGGLPSISIGMPVYNGEAFVEQAVLALCGQTERDWELIISDNDSTDRTGDLCRKLAASDSRIRYVRQQSNIGAAKNFEFVFRQSTGRYFMWAAADDMWDKHWLEHLAQTVISNPDCCAFGELRHVDQFGFAVAHTANGRTYSYTADSTLARRVRFFLEPEAKGKANAIYALYPRAAIDEYLPSFLAGYGYGDCVMLWRLLQKWKLKATHLTYIAKRLHNGAASGGMPREHRRMTLKEKLAGVWFTFATRTSLRGVTDYFRSEHSLTSLICFLLLPLKVIISLWSMRDRPADEIA